MTNTSIDKINFNFTYFALKTLGNNLYSNPWVAVSELVANGIDADAKKIRVLIDIRNKENATIEILDNGTGMTTEDLISKYAIIGRNKREELKNEKTLGRKGVGKLAALYLSSHYYIQTKTRTEKTCWEINTSKYKDSDIPGLEKVNSNINILSKKEWDNFETGTLIKLINVDLKSIGEQKIKSLKAILADYYLYDEMEQDISVAVIDENEDEAIFLPIGKKVYFDSFYAMFDNTGKYYNKMKKAVYLTGEDETYPEVDYPRETKVIDSFEELCNGSIEMENNEGKIINVPYQLKGWIGINCSLKEEIQKRNSPQYQKLLYRPNELKLYVRGKLAVSDVMKYIGSVHAFSNYIEGEISFDVLDRDDLEDIATSNREGYKLNDERIKKLIQILKPIVNKLITERASAGTKIKEQVEIIKYAKDLEVENANKSKQEMEKALSIVTKEKKEIEIKHQQANKRLFVLERNFIGSGENYKNGMHLAVNYAKAIKGKAIRLSRNIKEDNLVHLIDVIGYSENIIRLNMMLGKAKFSLSSPEIKENLFNFIKDYLKIISTSSLKWECDFKIDEYIVEFDFCEMSMAIENIISNSKKAKASKIIVSSYEINGKKYLKFKDDGKGVDTRISDHNDIFELGMTTTGGYGIGCYFIKKVLDKISNDIKIENQNGFGLVVELK